MLTTSRKVWKVMVTAVFLATAAPALAQTQPPEPPDLTLKEWQERLDAVLPKIITENNQELVAKLLNPRLDKPLAETFSPDVAIKKLFGRLGAAMAPDCRKTSTPTGEIDRGECKASNGSPGGQGTYLELNFSKHMAFGNISFFSRPAAIDIDPTKLKPVTISDEAAYKQAVEFLQGNFGLGTVEIPQPPPTARRPWPVRTLAMGWQDEKQEGGAVPLEKIVTLQRGLLVNAGPDLDWVPGPGKATVVLNDVGIAGIREAAIRGWQELLPHPAANAKNAKTRSQLISEIAEDLVVTGQGPVARISCRIALAAIPTERGQGLLVPAVQVRVAPVPGSLTEDEQAKVITSAGMIREFHLVRLEELNGDEPKPL